MPARTTPVYVPPNPVHDMPTRTTPLYVPPSPVHDMPARTTPVYVPSHESISPEYEPTSPEYVPSHESISPEYEPTSPEYVPSSPDYAALEIANETGFAGSVLGNLDHWYGFIRRQIIDESTVGNIITMDKSVGDIELPAGYEWNLPGIPNTDNWTDGPVKLDHRMYFRYGPSGLGRQKNLGGAGGSNSIIIFGKRLSDGKKVIARMQGYSQPPPMIGLVGDVASNEIDVMNKISEFVEDVQCHMDVHRLGLAGDIYSVTIMLWKSMPVETKNYPAVLSIMEAQDMDLESYFAKAYISHEEKVNAFIMFADKYMRLLQGGIATYDVKPGNVTVNVDADDNITGMFLIDIDAEYTFHIDANDTKRVTVYWIVAMLQSLMLAYQFFPQFDPLLRQKLNQFVRDRAWMNTTWEHIRDATDTTRDTEDETITMFLDTVAAYRKSNPDMPSEQEYQMMRTLHWYLRMRDSTGPRERLAMPLTRIREIAARPSWRGDSTPWSEPETRDSSPFTEGFLHEPTRSRESPSWPEDSHGWLKESEWVKPETRNSKKWSRNRPLELEDLRNMVQYSPPDTRDSGPYVPPSGDWSFQWSSGPGPDFSTYEPSDRYDPSPMDTGPHREPSPMDVVTPIPEEARRIEDATGVTWRTQQELDRWYDEIEEELRAMKLDSIMRLDRSTDFIELPGGYTWNLPGIGVRDGPVTLDDPVMFRYNSAGRRTNAGGGAGGTNSIIIFGERMSDGQKVIARMQGYRPTPDRLSMRGTPPHLGQIYSKLGEFAMDTKWHMEVHKYGLAGDIYEAVLMPWKSSPVGAFNYPSFLQISEAQHMDLMTYFKSPKTTEVQAVRAFEMFAEQYMELLQHGIATLDIKPGNMTVNVDSDNNVTKLCFIDIDDQYTCWINAANETQISVYWIAAVLQTLAMVSPLYHMSALFPETFGDEVSLLRKMLTAFIDARPWMQTTWDSIRVMSTLTRDGDLAVPNEVFLELLEKYENFDTFKKGKDYTLGRTLTWYMQLNESIDDVEARLNFSLDNIRRIASVPTFDELNLFAERRSAITQMGAQGGYAPGKRDRSESATVYGPAPAPPPAPAPAPAEDDSDASFGPPLPPGYAEAVRNALNQGMLDDIKKATGFNWGSTSRLNDWYADVRKDINTHNVWMDLDMEVGYISLPGGYEWDIPGAGMTEGPVELKDFTMFRYTRTGARTDNAGGAGGSNSIIIFGERLNGGERVIARLQGRHHTPDRLNRRFPAPSEDELTKTMTKFIKSTMWHTKVHDMGLAGEIYHSVLMPWKSSPAGCNNIPGMLQICAAQDMDLSAYFQKPGPSEKQKVAAFKMFMKNYMKLLESGIATLDLKPGNVTVNVDRNNNVTELYFIDIDDEYTCHIDKDNKKQVTVYWLAAVIQTLYIMSRYMIKGTKWDAFSSRVQPGDTTMLQDAIAQFISRHKWMDASWEAIRKLKAYGMGGASNRVVDLFKRLVETYDRAGLSTFNQGKDQKLARTLFHYTNANPWDSTDLKLEKMMQPVRDIAAQPVMQYAQFIKALSAPETPTRKDAVMRGLATRIGSMGL